MRPKAHLLRRPDPVLRTLRTGTATIALLLASALLIHGAAPAAKALEPAEEVQRELDARLAALEREVDRLQQAGRAAEADQLAQTLQHFRARLAGRAMSRNNEPELHVVGLYEGQRPRDGAGLPGTAVVEVQATDRPVVLALCAYEKVRWELRLAKEASLRRVIVSGYNDQRLENPPAGVAVEVYSHQRGDGNYFGAHSMDLEDYPRTARVLKEITGLEISTFQGAYRFRGDPIVIGPQNRHWMAQRLLHEIEPVYREAVAFERARQREALRPMRFTAIHWPEMDARMRGMPGALAEFTPLGPINGTEQALPVGVTHLAIDPGGPAWYGLKGHEVHRVDPKTGQTTHLPIDDFDLPELSWPCGLTFDTKRNRLVLSSLGGEGFLYAYSPARNKWTLLGSLRNVDLESLAYAAEDDCYYGLSASFGDEKFRPEILRYDATGELQRRVVLSESIQMLRQGPDARLQLVPVGRELVLLQPPIPDRSKPDAPPRMRSLLADPPTGRVTYSGWMEPQPAADREPPARGELEALWQALATEERPVAERTMWKLAAAGDQAVDFMRSRFPPIEPADADRIRKLVLKFDHEAAAVREEAGMELVRIGGPAEPELRRLLTEGASPEARARIEVALKRIRKLMPERSLEESADPDLRREGRAIWILSRIGTPAAVECLRELAAGPASPRAAEAAAALGRVGE